MPRSLRKLRRNSRQLRGRCNAYRINIEDLTRQNNKLRDSYAMLVAENTLARSDRDWVLETLRERDRTLSHPLHRFTSRIIAGLRYVMSFPARLKR